MFKYKVLVVIQRGFIELRNEMCSTCVFMDETQECIEDTAAPPYLNGYLTSGFVSDLFLFYCLVMLLSGAQLFWSSRRKLEDIRRNFGMCQRYSFSLEILQGAE